MSRGYVGSLDSDTMEIESLQSERDDFAPSLLKMDGKMAISSGEM